MADIVRVELSRQALQRWLLDESGLLNGPQPEALKETVQAAIDEGLQIGKPAFTFDVLTITGKRHDRILLEEGMVRNEWFAEMMAPAEKLIFFVCTIGPALEARARAYTMEKNAPLGYFLDTVGTGLVELTRCAAMALAEDIADQHGFEVSIPISPGDTAWPLAQQQVIFDLLPASELGVTLSPHYLMTPLKSTSFVVGIGADMGAAAEGSACDYCDLRENCKLRLTREAQGK